MKKYFLFMFLLAFTACTSRENSNSTEPSQNSTDSMGNGNNNGSLNNSNSGMLHLRKTHMTASLLGLLSGYDKVIYQDTGRRKMKRHHSQTYEGGGRSNMPPRVNNSNSPKVKNDQPPGNPVGNSGDNYEPSEGLKPDTNAKGTRVGNTYKSGNVHGEYQKVIKPKTDTGKVNQLHDGSGK